MSRRSIVTGLVVIFAVTLWIGITLPSEGRLRDITIERPAFGTSLRIEFPSIPPWHIGIHAGIDESLDAIDRTFSTWRTDSELSRFNENRSTDWIVVSTEFADLVDRAKRIAKRTGGAFDPTCGSLVATWKPDDSRDAELPSTEGIDRALNEVGHTKLYVRFDPPGLRKESPGLRIDLSGISKGKAVDVLHGLADYGEDDQSWLIELGGEIRVKGTWTIGIEAPVSGERRVMHKVELTDAALATSGDYRNFVERDGKRYSHIIDPRTGFPIDHDLASASVIAGTCAEADALATALMVMGPVEGRAFAERENLAVLLITRVKGEDGSAGFATWMSPHWPK